jgi:AraC-like DNA-binding protein
LRTLRRCFNEHFGIGPKAYISRYRLGQVRSALLRDRQDQSVMDIANEWVFWHMGQFAKDYRQMFGELPSMTPMSNRSG